MNESTENETTNVIEVQFNVNASDGNSDRAAEIMDDIANNIAHPASKNFSEELSDDPLYDLLHEFDDINLDNKENKIAEDYIFHLVGAEDVKLEMKESAKEMSDGVLTQIERLKEDFKRIKYYLDEMDLDE